MALLLVAGIDTTWSAIGSAIWHLAEHPEHRQRLVDEPEILPTAMEELLRAYAPVTMARLVREDMEWNGCPMKADDWMILPFPAANRDPEAFDRPDEVDFDREDNRHLAFGLGIHRCVGSNLARMEMRVALEVWLERYPDFSLDDPEAVTWSHGQVRGPRTLPIRVHRLAALRTGVRRPSRSPSTSMSSRSRRVDLPGVTVEHHEVGELAGLERADLVVAVALPGRVGRHRTDRRLDIRPVRPGSTRSRARATSCG